MKTAGFLLFIVMSSQGTQVAMAQDSVLMAQLVYDRKLKIEAFPGRSISHVLSFTPGAKTYER